MMIFNEEDDTKAMTIKKMNKMPQNSFMREQFVILYSSLTIVSIRILKTAASMSERGVGEAKEKRWQIASYRRRLEDEKKEPIRRFSSKIHDLHN